MIINRKRRFGCLGLAFAACLVLKFFAARDTQACSIIDSDWEVTYANVVDEEIDVPTNLVLRMELLRWSEQYSYLHYETGVDPDKFKLVCNDEEVEGDFYLSDGGPIFVRSEPRHKDGEWLLEYGCKLPCELGRVFLQLEFFPKKDLTAHSSCELVLSEFCATHECISSGDFGGDYPRTLVSFETGDSLSSNSLELGEPEVEAFIYKSILQECKRIGPDLGSCSSCVEVSTQSGWGVVLAYPDIQEAIHELQVNVFIADSVSELETAEAETFLLDPDILDDKVGIALALGGKNDRPRCIQGVVFDRIGRQTKRSAPVCLDPCELSWPRESSGCSAGGKGGVPVALFGLMFFLVTIRGRHKTRASHNS